MMPTTENMNAPMKVASACAPGGLRSTEWSHAE